MAVVSSDGQINASRGVQGGHDGPPGKTFKVRRDGTEEKLPGVVEVRLEQGEFIRGIDSGGAGYGNPLAREPTRVLRDVMERWETFERARELYGVVFNGTKVSDELRVDEIATAALREKLVRGAASPGSTS